MFPGNRYNISIREKGTVIGSFEGKALKRKNWVAVRYKNKYYRMNGPTEKSGIWITLELPSQKNK